MIAALIGLAAAIVGTPTGVSGGLLLLPLLLTGFGLTGTVASATNLVFNVVATPAGVLRYHRHDGIDPVTTRLLVGAATPAAVVGALINVFLLGDSPAFRVLVAVLLLVVAGTLAFARRGPRHGHRPPTPSSAVLTARQRGALLATGAASGVLGGFYGLGGAVLAAPAAVLITRRPVHRIAGPALVTTLAVSVSGLATYALLDQVGRTRFSTPDWPLGLALGVGGLLGAYLAARTAHRLPDRLLRTTLAILVTVGALRLLIG